MSVELPSDWRDYVDHSVVTGKFPSATDVVVEALRRMKEQEANETHAEWLKREIGIGLAESARGEGMDAEEFFEQLEKEFPGIFDEDDADECASA